MQSFKKELKFVTINFWNKFHFYYSGSKPAATFDNWPHSLAWEKYSLWLDTRVFGLLNHLKVSISELSLDILIRITYYISIGVKRHLVSDKLAVRLTFQWILVIEISCHQWLKNLVRQFDLKEIKIEYFQK